MPDTFCPRLSGRGLWNRLPIATAAAAVALLCGVTTALAQKYTPTATKRADLEIGGGYAFASPDYSNVRFAGLTGYAALDVTPHWGAEVVFHQVNTTGDDNIYERTYEIGPRYVRHYGRFNPFVRATYGRGVFNFPYNQANLAYNIYAGAIGLDFRVESHVYVRAEYEAQFWPGFVGRSLQPDVTTVGVAYHF